MTSTMWLLRDGTVLANAEIAGTYAERMRGLLGHPGFEGAFVLPHTRSVHTLGMRFAIDVAFLDRRLCVLDVISLAPWRMSMPRSARPDGARGRGRRLRALGPARRGQARARRRP